MTDQEIVTQNAQVALEKEASNKARQAEVERESAASNSFAMSPARKFWTRRRELLQKIRNKSFAGFPAEVVKTIAYTP